MTGAPGRGPITRATLYFAERECAFEPGWYVAVARGCWYGEPVLGPFGSLWEAAQVAAGLDTVAIAPRGHSADAVGDTRTRTPRKR